MLIDTQTKFSDSQAITATAISTNVLDLRNASTPTFVDEGINNAPEAWLIIQSITAAAGGDAAKTITFTLESATDTGLSSGNVAHFTSAAITGATMTAGATLVRVPLPSADYRRYLGVRYTLSAGFTSFAITAFIAIGAQRNVVYPTGFVVS